MNAYYTNATNTKEIVRNSLPKINVKSGFIEFICSLVAFFTCEISVKVEKVACSFVCFIAFFGIAGGMDNGYINIFAGLLGCGICTVLQVVILKSIFNKKKNTQNL